MSELIFGMESAIQEAMKVGLGVMDISAPLVLEMALRVKELEQQNQALQANAGRLREALKDLQENGSFYGDSEWYESSDKATDVLAETPERAEITDIEFNDNEIIKQQNQELKANNARLREAGLILEHYDEEDKKRVAWALTVLAETPEQSLREIQAQAVEKTRLAILEEAAKWDNSDHRKPVYAALFDIASKLDIEIDLLFEYVKRNQLRNQASPQQVEGES